jgi:pyridoxine 5-phosphate synthase
MAPKLSVNINKIATLRNSRGGNNPDVLKVAIDCQRFGAEGITVHPRPDERHIRYQDARDLKSIVTTEFNIEGNPKEESFVKLVLEVKPTQVTLVPDSRDQLTSNHGWDTKAERKYLTEIIEVFKKENIRVSIFVDPNVNIVAAAENTGTDRIELYTENYARQYKTDPHGAIADYLKAAAIAKEKNLGLNAGHDLDMQNLGFFSSSIDNLLEVSIGHALVCDALYYGLENTIQMYRKALLVRKHPILQ